MFALPFCWLKTCHQFITRLVNYCFILQRAMTHYLFSLRGALKKTKLHACMNHQGIDITLTPEMLLYGEYTKLCLCRLQHNKLKNIKEKRFCTVALDAKTESNYHVINHSNYNSILLKSMLVVFVESCNQKSKTSNQELFDTFLMTKICDLKTNNFTTNLLAIQESILNLSSAAGARWLSPPPPTADVGAPNIQHIAFNT